MLLTAATAALEGINGSAPYTTTVRKVNDVAVNNLRSAGANSPALNIYATAIEHEDPAAMGSDELMRVELEIEGWVELEDGQKPYLGMLPLWEDVRTCVRANRTWSGAAVSTDFNRTEFSHGEAESMFRLRLTVTIEDTTE